MSFKNKYQGNDAKGCAAAAAIALQPDLCVPISDDFKPNQRKPGEHREVCWALEESQPWATPSLLCLCSAPWKKEFPCVFQHGERSVSHQDTVFLLTP